MIPANLENLVPGLRELRAQERDNRALAFAGLTRRVLGVDILPLTPGHRLGLQLVRNAFAFNAEALEGDIFQFLWFLHPLRGTWRGWLERSRVKRLARACDLARARREIHTFIAGQMQDQPALATAPDNFEADDYLHWMAAEAGFWIEVHGGFTLESYARTPYLVLQQLHRVWQCNHPKLIYNKDGSVDTEPPHFINQSDRLLGAWQRARSSEISAIIRERRERLPN